MYRINTPKCTLFGTIRVTDLKYAKHEAYVQFQHEFRNHLVPITIQPIVRYIATNCTTL